MKIFFLLHLVLYITFWCYVFFGGAPRVLCSITGNTTAQRATAKQYPAYISSRQHLTDIKKLPGRSGVGVQSGRAGVGENVHGWLSAWWNLLQKQHRGGKQQTQNGIRQVLHLGWISLCNSKWIKTFFFLLIIKLLKRYVDCCHPGRQPTSHTLVLYKNLIGGEKGICSRTDVKKQSHPEAGSRWALRNTLALNETKLLLHGKAKAWGPWWISGVRGCAKH